MIALVTTEKPSLEEVVTWIEWETLLLISGMMIIVAVFCETGLFDLIAVRLFHYCGDRIWLMVGSLCLLSAVLSAVLDNVTTILLLTPITIRLCEVMKLDPRNIIIGEVIFSNIGGCRYVQNKNLIQSIFQWRHFNLSTAIGDPPNVIITANHEINASGIDFSIFTMHMFVGVVFVYAVSFLHFRLLLSSPNNFLKDLESEFDELKTEIKLWSRTYQSITPVTKGEKIVKTLLKEKVSQLESLLAQNLISLKSEYKSKMRIKSQDMLENYKITNTSLLIKCAIIFVITLVLFFLNPFVSKIQLTIGWISILAALVLLAASSNNSADNSGDNTNAQTDPMHSHLNGIGFEAIMHKLEWSKQVFIL